MKAATGSKVPALLRNSVFLAGMLALPGLSGCMSAIDESSAFGFAQNAPAAPAEGTAPAAADAAQTAAAEPAAQNAEGSAAGELAEAAPQTPAAAAAVQAEPADGLSTQTAATFGAPRRSDALAAFATPRRQADTSLFASLSQRAEAEQPEPAAVAEEVSSRVVVTHTDGMGKPSPSAELPGVDPSSLFKIGRRASVDDEELLDDIGGSYQIASLGGMARLAPNGLMVARDDVNTSCFGSDLVRMLRQIEQRFGKKVVITSGFRSPSHNRRVRGAKASLHMACKAADLHVPGVSGMEVARYVRALPNRGGVGTYCHTAAIHVDVGKQRDWNWPCRRRG